MEVLGYKLTEAETQLLEALFKSGNKLEITDDVVAEVIKIRKAVKIKLPDAIIAATAVVYNLQLVTGNTKDFLKVEGLNAVNPVSI